MHSEIYNSIMYLVFVVLSGLSIFIGYKIGFFLEKKNSSSYIVLIMNDFLNTKLGKILMNIIVFLLKWLVWLSDILIILGVFLLFLIIYKFNNYEFGNRIYFSNVYINISIYILIFIFIGYGYYNVYRYKKNLFRYLLAVVVGGFFLSYFLSGGDVIKNRFFIIVKKVYSSNKDEYYFFLVCSFVIIICYVMLKLLKYIKIKKIYNNFFLFKKKVDMYLYENYDYVCGDKDNPMNSRDNNDNVLYSVYKSVDYKGFSVKKNKLVFDINDLTPKYNYDALYEKDKEKCIKYLYATYFFRLPIRPELLNLIEIKKLPSKYCFLNLIYKNNSESMEEYMFILNRIIRSEFKIYFVFTYTDSVTDIVTDEKDQVYCEDILLCINKIDKKAFIEYIETSILEYKNRANVEIEYHINILYDINLFFSREIFLEVNKKYLKNGFFFHGSHSFFIYEYVESMLCYYIYGYILLNMEGSNDFFWCKVTNSLKFEISSNFREFNDFVSNEEIVSLFSTSFFDRKNSLINKLDD